MKVILDDEQYDKIWDKIYDDFHFFPSIDPDCGPWLSLPMPHKRYRLNGVFSEEQEKIVNAIFCRVNPTEMYALNWQHDCFIYDPREEIPLYDWYHDDERDCNVYFPSYYPNGDYYFFVSMDWSMGLYGHPWRHEIMVVGEALIREFDQARDALHLTEL